MQFRLNGSRRSEPQILRRVERTSISFTSEDLLALARLIQAGHARARGEQRTPVIARVKAAMIRLGVAIPQGL